MLMRSSSISSLGELAKKIAPESPRRNSIEKLQSGADGVLEDYSEDFPLYEKNARIIYRLLSWEYDWQKRSVREASLDQPINNQQSKPSLIASLSLFANKIVENIANKPAIAATDHFLEQVIRHILLSGSSQRLVITAMGSEMLRHFCREDNAKNPSILFDAILVGTMVLTLAVDDAVDDTKGKAATGHLYPVTLENICDICELHRRYAVPQQYDTDSELLNHILQYLILQLGYRVLVQKTLPFKAELALEFFSGLTNIFPVERFGRYQLSAVECDFTDKYLNWHGNDLSEHLTQGDVYELWMLKKCISDGLSEEQIFDVRHDFHAALGR